MSVIQERNVLFDNSTVRAVVSVSLLREFFEIVISKHSIAVLMHPHFALTLYHAFIFFVPQFVTNRAICLFVISSFTSITKFIVITPSSR